MNSVSSYTCVVKIKQRDEEFGKGLTFLVASNVLASLRGCEKSASSTPANYSDADSCRTTLVRAGKALVITIWTDWTYPGRAIVFCNNVISSFKPNQDLSLNKV
ncbi:Uncharacterized protein Rs2_47777 [Raphanus sativus]|nr:Uncharacterized protein Rs2_47777 [Raphanus sativus]